MSTNKPAFIQIANDIINIDCVTHLELADEKHPAKIFFNYQNEQNRPAAYELPDEIAADVLEVLKPLILNTTNRS